MVSLMKVIIFMTISMMKPLEYASTSTEVCEVLPHFHITLFPRMAVCRFWSAVHAWLPGADIVPHCWRTCGRTIRNSRASLLCVLSSRVFRDVLISQIAEGNRNSRGVSRTRVCGRSASLFDHVFCLDTNRRCIRNCRPCYVLRLCSADRR